MNCHSGVTATLAAVKLEEETAKQQNRAAQAVRVRRSCRSCTTPWRSTKTLQPSGDKTPEPIAWKRIHKLPDFVYFDHRAHITATVSVPDSATVRSKRWSACGSTKRSRMGWCVNCHRDVNENGVNGKQVHASIDCVTCHY